MTTQGTTEQRWAGVWTGMAAAAEQLMRDHGLGWDGLDVYRATVVEGEAARLGRWAAHLAEDMATGPHGREHPDVAAVAWALHQEPWDTIGWLALGDALEDAGLDDPAQWARNMAARMEAAGRYIDALDRGRGNPYGQPIPHGTSPGEVEWLRWQPLADGSGAWWAVWGEGPDAKVAVYGPRRQGGQYTLRAGDLPTGLGEEAAAVAWAAGRVQPGHGGWVVDGILAALPAAYPSADGWWWGDAIALY